MASGVRKFVITALLVFSATTLAEPARANQKKFQQAISFFQSKNYAASRDLLSALVSEEPSNALYWFNLGNAYFMLKEYSKSERAFAKVEALGSRLALAAKLYRAKSLVERGEAARARALLRELLSATDLPPALREQASHDLVALVPDENADPAAELALSLYRQGRYSSALRAIDRRRVTDDNTLMLKAMILIKLDREDEAQRLLRRVETSTTADLQKRNLVMSLMDRARRNEERPKWLYAEVAGGWDSNRASAADAKGAAPLLAAVGAGVNLRAEDLWQWNLGYSGNLKESTGHPELRVLSHEVQTSYGRTAGAELVMLTAFLEHTSFESRPALLASGGRFRIRTGAEAWEFGSETEVAKLSALNGDYGYLKGTSSRARIYTGYIRYPVYTQAYLDLERENLGDQAFSTGEAIPTAYTGWGPGARVTWLADRRWAIDASVAYSLRDYKTLSQPGGKARDDRQLAWNLRITHIFDSRLSVYAAAAQTNNTSSLGEQDVSNENYQRTLILLGALWDAF